MCISSSAEAIPPTRRAADIRQVWSWNFEEEWTRLLATVLAAGGGGAIIALNVTMPGFLRAQPASADSFAEFRILCDSTSLLRPVQVSFAVASESGAHFGTWDFNLCFNVLVHHHTQEALATLWAAGVDLARHAAHGVDIDVFRHKLQTSSLVEHREEAPAWVTFSKSHCLGHVLHLLTGEKLPPSIPEFEAALAYWCPKRQELQANLSWADRCCSGTQTAAKVLQEYLRRRQNASAWLQGAVGGSSTVLNPLSYQSETRGHEGREMLAAADAMEPAATPSQLWAAAARQAMSQPRTDAVRRALAPQLDIVD